MPNQLLGVRVRAIAMSGLSHVRTELLRLLVIPSLAHRPVQANRHRTDCAMTLIGRVIQAYSTVLPPALVVQL